jgi:hypothetical protein
MNYDKNWLTKEINILKKTEKYDKKNKNDSKIMLKFIFVLGLIACAGLSANENFTCPHCYESLEVHAEVRPGKWKCPKKSCGYENDNRIRYCALCGSERQ